MFPCKQMLQHERWDVSLGYILQALWEKTGIIGVVAQAMWYYVQPPLASLGLAASVASEAAARKLRGASLLNLLHSRYAAVAGVRSL